ncbi:MAG: SusE domain-containing protein [Bacteroidales bacterium]|nr:SusE domain-containing protein [Bacteroidales bacterium]
MKKITLILITIIGLGFLYSCEKQLKDPVLDMSQTIAPEILTPEDSSEFVLLKKNADSLFTFQWKAAIYNLQNIGTVKYEILMDIADSCFKNEIKVGSTTENSFTITVNALNQKLIAMGVAPEVPVDISFRIKSYISKDYDLDNAYSEPITLNLTAYNDAIVIKPIYLLGSATTVGWNNAAALPCIPIGDSKFAIVETLTAGTDMYIKFISVLGQWAPQWGTDETGTFENGPLIYRPTEEVPDPAAIPAPETDGDYYIEADTAALTYTVSATSAQLYLVGDGCSVGWDNANGIEFTKESPGIFSLVTTLNAEGEMKFLEVSGQWAPQWGTDEDGTAEGGNLIYRPTENVTDPVNIPTPGAGTYKIELNLITKKYTITAQ